MRHASEYTWSQAGHHFVHKHRPAQQAAAFRSLFPGQPRKPSRNLRLDEPSFGRTKSVPFRPIQFPQSANNTQRQLSRHGHDALGYRPMWSCSLFASTVLLASQSRPGSRLPSSNWSEPRSSKPAASNTSTPPGTDATAACGGHGKSTGRRKAEFGIEPSSHLKPTVRDTVEA